MKANIKIDLHNGVFTATGPSEFVESVYKDFRDVLKDNFGKTSLPNENARNRHVEAPSEAPKKSTARPKRSAKKQSAPSSEVSTSGVNFDNPKLDKNLDLSKLKAFCENSPAKNNSEKVLVFGMFFEERTELEHANSDQYYSCFKEMSFTVPEAFRQTFVTTSGSRHGYIDYDSADKIVITTKGRNHFVNTISKRGGE